MTRCWMRYSIQPGQYPDRKKPGPALQRANLLNLPDVLHLSGLVA